VHSRQDQHRAPLYCPLWADRAPCLQVGRDCPVFFPPPPRTPISSRDSQFLIEPKHKQQKLAFIFLKKCCKSVGNLPVRSPRRLLQRPQGRSSPAPAPSLLPPRGSPRRLCLLCFQLEASLLPLPHLCSRLPSPAATVGFSAVNEVATIKVFLLAQIVMSVINCVNRGDYEPGRAHQMCLYGLRRRRE